MDSTSSSPLRIAIVGGGLCGLTVANALVHYRDLHGEDPALPLEVRVYEAKPELAERGANVGLSGNAKRALRDCVPNADLMLAEAGAVHMVSTCIMLGSGTHGGAVIANLGPPASPVPGLKDFEAAYQRFAMAQQELESLRASGKKSLTKTDVASCAAETDRHTSVVYRPRLLKGLAASLDASTLHTRKQLASACAGPAGAVELTFVDGTAATADVVVGADGIFSVMRRHVLADRAAAEAPVAASFWDARNIVPMATARAKLLEPLRAALRARAGDDDATARQAVDDLFGAGDRSDAHRQWGWVGAGAMLLFDVHDGGEAAQVVICGEETDTEPWAERKRPLTRGFLEAHLGGWLPVLRDATIALMLDQASPTRWREWHSPRTSTYHRDRAVLVGDAAHATTPWQGAGAGMAFEDAVLLARLLGRVGARAHVGAALETFTESRLARCAAVVESSHGTGWILCGRRYSEGEEIAPGADLEPGRVGAALGGRWNLILAYRLDAACEEAVEKFMGKIQSN